MNVLRKVFAGGAAIALVGIPTPQAAAQIPSDSGKPRVNASFEAFGVNPAPQNGDTCFCMWLGVARGSLTTGGITSAHGQASVFDAGLLWQQSIQPIVGIDIPGTSETDLTLQNVPKDDRRTFVAPAPQGFPPTQFYAVAPVRESEIPVLFVGAGVVGRTVSHVDSIPSSSSSVVVGEGFEQKSGSSFRKITASVDASWRAQTLVTSTVSTVSGFVINARDQNGRPMELFTAKSVESVARIENDGLPGGEKALARTTVTDARLAGVPVVIDESGITIDRTKIPDPVQQQTKTFIDLLIDRFQLDIVLLDRREEIGTLRDGRVHTLAATQGVYIHFGRPTPSQQVGPIQTPPSAGAVGFVVGGASAAADARPPGPSLGALVDLDTSALLPGGSGGFVLGDSASAAALDAALGNVSPLAAVPGSAGGVRRVVSEQVSYKAPPIGAVAGVLGLLLWLATAVGFVFRETQTVRTLVAAPERAWEQYARYLVRG